MSQSQAEHSILNLAEDEPELANTHDVPGAETAKGQEKESNFADGSSPLFSMYQKMVEKVDNQMAERWQKDAEGILIFTGLFSAAVAALLAVTVPNLQPNPQDTSAFYLQRIYQFQVLTDSNSSRPSTPDQPPSFSVPKYAIWVNSLWFLSLSMSLTGAMLATLQQQWARRYLRSTQPPQSTPHDRARMREYFAHGIESLHFSRVLDAIPTLIHLSLFLFFSGLLIYLFHVSHPVFLAVVWWIGVSAMLYLAIAFMPFFRPDSPYRAPISSPACHIPGIILYLAFNICSILVFFTDSVKRRLDDKSNQYRRWVTWGKKKITEKVVEELSSEIDGRILKWMFNSLVEDHELEKFFQKILGFCDSTVVKDPRRALHDGIGEFELSWTLYKFLERTWLTNLVSDSDKQQRFVMCVDIVDAAYLHDAALSIHGHVSDENWNRVVRSVGMGRSLGRRSNRTGKEMGLFAQSIIAQIISNVQGGNEQWVALATDQLGEDLPRYLRAGNDSVLLANLIHIIKQIFTSSSKTNWKMVITILDFTLPSFHVQNALPELRHQFCLLWNEIARKAHEPGSADIDIYYFLRRIRNLYVDLHQGTPAAPTAFDASTSDNNPVLTLPSSYPLCNIPDHRCNVHKADTTDDITHSGITSPSAHPPDMTMVPTAITPSTVSPLASNSDPSHAHPPEEPPLLNVPDIIPVIEPSRCSRPVNVENHDLATTSPVHSTAIATAGPAGSSIISPSPSSSSPIPVLVGGSSDTPPADSLMPTVSHASQIAPNQGGHSTAREL